MSQFHLKFRVLDSFKHFCSSALLTATVTAAISVPVTAMLFVETSCEAGTLFVVAPQWVNFVFEPIVQEETPNYYGYGAKGSFGYSIKQIFDFDLYGEYSPGRLNSASSSNASAVVLNYGGEVGFRLLNAMFLGARCGQWNYRLIRRIDVGEVGGSWTGFGGAASFGMLLPVNKEVQWQLSLDIGQALLKKDNREIDDIAPKTRVISKASITLSFVYNSRDTMSALGALFY